MKKIIILALAIIVSSCSSKIETTTIQGTILNYDNQEFKLYSLNGTDEILSIDEQGNFEVSQILPEGFYKLLQGRTSIEVYLQPGAVLNLSFDAENFVESSVFTGDLSAENNYLLAKKEQLSAFNKEIPNLYKKDEADFLLAMKTGTEQDIAVLGQTAHISTHFLKLETKNLMYTKARRMDMYKSYHAHYAKVDAQEPSEAFKAEIPKVTLNNYQDYVNSGDFRSLVSGHFYDLAEEDLKENEDADYYYTYLNEIKNSDFDPKIKSLLAFQNAQNSITYTDDLDNYYQIYLELDADEAHRLKITEVYNKLQKLKKGEVSPTFANYENYKGGTSSLKDFEGKYVYMDIWAQWCGPCKREIPSLKKVEAAYHNKNIEFVSISVDKEKDYDKWRAMIADKELGGVQLLADKNWQSDFIKEYMIRGIPRFILVDPQGNIVSWNAPRPSSEKLIKLFDQLKI